MDWLGLGDLVAAGHELSDPAREWMVPGSRIWRKHFGVYLVCATSIQESPCWMLEVEIGPRDFGYIPHRFITILFDCFAGSRKLRFLLIPLLANRVFQIGENCLWARESPH